MPRPVQWPNQVVWSVSDDQLAAVREVQKLTGESEAGAARLLLDAGIEVYRENAEAEERAVELRAHEVEVPAPTKDAQRIRDILDTEAQSSGSSESDRPIGGGV